MTDAVVKIGLYIGLIVQGCLAGMALATPLDVSPLQRQHIDLLPKKPTPYAETMASDYIDRQLLQVSHSADTLLPHIPLEQHSNKPVDPIGEWRSWQDANLPNRDDDKVSYHEDLYSNYEETYNDPAAITLGEALQLYVNSAGDGPNQTQRDHQRNRSYPGDSLGLVKNLLKLTLDEKQAEQLLAITEPWQDDSGTRHFSLFGTGDFVMESTPVHNDANSHTSPKNTYHVAPYYKPTTTSKSRPQPPPEIEHLTLKERLYELIDDTIGWSMLYLLIIVTGIWLLTLSVFKLLHSHQAQ